MTQERPYDWHRLFGLTLTDVFQDTPWRVELEKDLAMQRQLLDVVIIEQTAPDGAAADLPDGLDNLCAHNLLTYKSNRNAGRLGAGRTARALCQLPQADRPKTGLLPETDFQLYAVATRYPQGLAGGRALQPTAWTGVYDIEWARRRSG